MTKWYLEIRKILRDIRTKAQDALKASSAEDESSVKPIKEYIKKDYERLESLWREEVDEALPTNLGRHVYFGMSNDFEDILRRDLPEFESILDLKLAATIDDRGDLGFEYLLHPIIKNSSYELFRTSHLREAVLNSITAVFDLIRARTGIDLDGSKLVERAFSLAEPYLVLSEIDSESGTNDQKGFIQLFSGSYLAVRNPKAHSLSHDLTEMKAAQYLVHASLLARRVEEAISVKREGSAQSGGDSRSSRPTRRSHS